MRRSVILGAASTVLLLAALPAVAAVLRVTTPADAGDGSLRAAFAAAHGGDRIVLALPGAGAATIRLAAALPPVASAIVVELRPGAPDVTIGGGAMTLAAKGGLSFEIAPGRTVELDLPITGADGDRGLAIVGGGALVLAAPCDYRGATTVSDATLRLAQDGSLPPKGGLTLAGGRFELGPRDAQVGALAGEGGTIALGSHALAVDQDSDSQFQGTIGGAGRFTKAGNGRLVLKAEIDWTGGILVTGGVLELAGTKPGQGVQIHGPVMLKGGALITPGVRLDTGPAPAPVQ